MTSASRVLIVEDHTMIAEYLASVLAAGGYEAIQAHALQQARQRLADHRFDLWLCDRHLPDGESSILLQEHPDHPPAIVLSASIDPGGHADLVALGFAATLGKPCAPRTLLACVAQVLAAAPVRPPVPDDNAPLRVAESAPVLDDAAALARCGGDRSTLADLRRMLAAELPQVRARLRSAAGAGAGDRTILVAELHRLTGAAGWIGADQVGLCLRAVQAVLREGHDPALALLQLEAALDRLLPALLR